MTSIKITLLFRDNAGSHRNNYVKDAITESENNYLFFIPYTPHTNGAIEAYFNQIKHYLKLNKKVLKFNDLKKEVKKAIKKVKRENYKNYFLYAYKKKEEYLHWSGNLKYIKVNFYKLNNED